jgi:hypothetical protein
MHSGWKNKRRKFGSAHSIRRRRDVGRNFNQILIESALFELLIFKFNWQVKITVKKLKPKNA